MPTAAGIDYREQGSGRPVVFVHGVGVNGLLWRDVAPRVAKAGYRCISPDLPMGAHTRPMPPDADLSLPGLAGIVADLLEELGLEDVVVVANDTGGAVAQWLVGHRASRVGALVLTSCDAWEVFPPKPQLYLIPAARLPGALWTVGQLVRFRWVQRTPFAYGWTTREAMPDDVMRSFTTPVRTVPGVRRDLRRLLLAVDKRYTFEAAEALPSFDKPALVVWGDQDKLFPREHGERLASLLPQGRFELMPDSRGFVPMEQPAALAERIVEFLGAPRAANVHLPTS
ncbi:MAG TPA: alpha/beta hydrolase [Thermoleophilaceae bacterium]|nr:alpha/beta hydrolase [Thermoleophilaceae bacterium]